MSTPLPEWFRVAAVVSPFALIVFAAWLWWLRPLIARRRESA